MNNKYAIKFTSAGPIMVKIIDDEDKIETLVDATMRNNLFSFSEAKTWISEWFKSRAVFVENLEEKDYESIFNGIGEESKFQESLSIGDVS